MIEGIFQTILPTLLVVIFLLITVRLITGVKSWYVLKAIGLGILIVIPALLTMELLGILVTIIQPVTVPLLFFRILSALNEEFFKFITISKPQKEHPIIFAIFLGAGFSLCETLYLSLGDSSLAFYRTVTSLPLHIITSVILSKAIIQKRYFLLAVLMHLSFNLILT